MQSSIFNSMLRYFWIGFLFSLTIWSGTSLAIDCRLGAEYYYRAKSETDTSTAIAWLNKSVHVCPNFNAWYMLGLLYSNQGETHQAIEAFSQAKSQAVSSKTEALTLARRGELLARNGQSLLALRALELARRFHPEPVPDWLENSLKDVRIQIYQTLIPASDIAYIFASGTQTSTDGRFAVRPALNLPVHFDFDQANLNSAGRRQVIELGAALSASQRKQRSFLLVGHTDKRGSHRYNQRLSEKRAATVKMELERRFSSLAGRLQTIGRGETDLLYDGETETDHMLNRRVRVTLFSN
jgi:outer membrane protein OmpA-like peptidoglycan-associated protein